jgi:two-component system cell cycle response regulator
MPISFENMNSAEVQENAGSAREKLLENALARTKKELQDVRKSARLGDALIGILLTAREADEREKKELRDKLRKSEQKLNVNPTTGLPTRGSLKGHFEERRAQSEGGIYTMMFVDIDKFKIINDTYGHDAGDAVLREVGQRLQNMAQRAGDIVIHPHGDEFEVLFEGVSEESVGAKMKDKKLSFNVEYEGKQIPVSLSVGLAPYIPGESLEDARRRADDAMYVSKRGGDVAHEEE